MKETFWFLLWAIADTHSVTPCHFEDDSKVIFPDRHIILSFLIWNLIIIYENNDNDTLWQRKNVGHIFRPSLMVSLSWVVFIDYITFTMIIVWFCYIWIEFKDWWFYSCYGPHDFSYMNTFIVFFVVVAIKYCLVCWIYELWQIPCVF